MTNVKIDLHIHKIYSDGRLSVKELIMKAKEENVTHMALKDHDPVNGCKETVEYGKQHGIKVFLYMSLITLREPLCLQDKKWYSSYPMSLSLILNVFVP